MSAASFLHSSFLQTVSAVMLWPVYVEKVPQALLHMNRISQGNQMFMFAVVYFSL